MKKRVRVKVKESFYWDVMVPHLCNRWYALGWLAALTTILLLAYISRGFLMHGHLSHAEQLAVAAVYWLFPISGLLLAATEKGVPTRRVYPAAVDRCRLNALRRKAGKTLLPQPWTRDEFDTYCRRSAVKAAARRYGFGRDLPRHYAPIWLIWTRQGTWRRSLLPKLAEVVTIVVMFSGSVGAFIIEVPAAARSWELLILMIVALIASSWISLRCAAWLKSKVANRLHIKLD